MTLEKLIQNQLKINKELDTITIKLGNLTQTITGDKYGLMVQEKEQTLFTGLIAELSYQQEETEHWLQAIDKNIEILKERTYDKLEEPMVNSIT